MDAISIQSIWILISISDYFDYSRSVFYVAKVKINSDSFTELLQETKIAQHPSRSWMKNKMLILIILVLSSLIIAFIHYNLTKLQLAQLHKENNSRS